MSMKAERSRHAEKKPKRAVKRARTARPGEGEMPRILESSRTRGLDIRVSRPWKRTA